MVKVIATAAINGNEIQLVEKQNIYYIYWGGHNKTEQKLLTPTGKKPSQTSAYKQFLKACKASKYIKFSKL
jgi:hypothetical protein